IVENILLEEAIDRLRVFHTKPRGSDTSPSVKRQTRFKLDSRQGNSQISSKN
ncbi:hypothetical protein HAX54_039750, partial [Datura stramonium]|nr:hypothetical protein [Datura stramonium]